MRVPLRSEREPASGSSSPARIFKSVDLPEPLGPTSPTRSPSKRPNVRFSNSGRAPNCFDTDSQERRRGRELMAGGGRVSRTGSLRRQMITDPARELVFRHPARREPQEGEVLLLLRRREIAAV